MARRILALVCAVIVAAGALVLVPALAGAQDGTTSSTPVPVEDIIPRPNSGHAPHDAGDRGGALQLLLPVLLVAAVGGGAWHLTREARRAQRGQP